MNNRFKDLALLGVGRTFSSDGKESDTLTKSTKKEPYIPENFKDIVLNIEIETYEKDRINEHLKELFKGAKEEGIDIKVLRKLLKQRREDKKEREQNDKVLQAYLAFLEKPKEP